MAEFIQIDINVAILRFNVLYTRAVKLRKGTISFMSVGRHGTDFLLLDGF